MWGEEVEVLEHHPHLLAQLVDVGLVHLDPLELMVPPVGFSSRFRQRRKVDLPQPDGPIRQTTSPPVDVDVDAFQHVQEGGQALVAPQ